MDSAVPKLMSSEIAKALRDAYVLGARNHRECPNGLPFVDCQSCQAAIRDAKRDAERLFPMPTVTVSRVFTNKEGYEYKVVDGKVFYRHPETPLAGWMPSYTDPDFVRGVADLLNRPTDEVPADDPRAAGDQG
jgi:hypothetical protein